MWIVCYCGSVIKMTGGIDGGGGEAGLELNRVLELVLG